MLQFSDVSGQDGLIQNCETLSKLGNAGISGDTVLMAKFTSWINQAYDKVAMAILQVDKNWRWDDFNYSNPNGFPVATCTLVANQRDYVLPRATNSSDQSTLWKVYKVRIQDTNGVWYDLVPLSADDDETDNDSGKPSKYRLLANSIRLSDPPNATGVTLSGGIQVWFQRAFVKFVVGDTTKCPGFMSSFHGLLALDASASFLLPTEPALANEYLTLFRNGPNGLEDLKVAYGNRNDDSKTTKRMTPFIEDTR